MSSLIDVSEIFIFIDEISQHYLHKAESKQDAIVQ